MSEKTKTPKYVLVSELEREAKMLSAYLVDLDSRLSRLEFRNAARSTASDNDFYLFLFFFAFGLYVGRQLQRSFETEGRKR